MRVHQTVGGLEAEAERIAGAGRVAVGERHRDGAALRVDLCFERQVAREAVHRQIAHDAGAVAPAADLSIDKMPAQKRKQQGIAAADPRRLAPVGLIGPMDDRLAIDVP